MARSLLLITSLLFILASCKKAEETTSSEDTLRGGQWKRASLKVTYQGTTSDEYAAMPDCLKDNTLAFKTNYQGTEYRNMKCTAGDAGETSFAWEFINSGAGLRIYNANETFGNSIAVPNSNSSEINATVVQLTDNQLTMRYQLYSQDPIDQTTDTFTFVDVFRR